ncbi:hypothetical protein CERZMDRAFT_98855 [Cercospora zeae-maydis SCOH1-5]|uniref:Uncharacterized protein n=1 Tax=Cercospora zeae-maydis SCOH1-5 TaxID=717836 RepID=A0A6A6FCR2_9PEZI|nr:hypothetical protein CERZMDRAFT_98855 [Cercospora zeae-maydis SCOH1-5]
MASSQPGIGAYLKPLAYTSTMLIGVTNLSTSVLFIPALLRPVTTIATNSQPENSPVPESLSRTPSLVVPQTPTESGRLTPQISQRSFDFSQHLGSSGTYKAVARQFSQLQSLSTMYSVPLEIIAIVSLGTLAYTDRRASSESWKSWAGAGGILVTVDLLKTWFVAPLALKVLTVAGDAEPIEPYEDAPIDREAEKSNTVQFLRKWSVLNLASSVVVLGAAGLAWSAEF